MSDPRSTADRQAPVHFTHVIGEADTCYRCGCRPDGSPLSYRACIPNPCPVRCVFHLTGGHVADRHGIDPAWRVYGWSDGATKAPAKVTP